MKINGINRKNILGSAAGAALSVACGLILWGTKLGDVWTNASYDYLFRFGARAVTNNVTVILMDNESYDYFHQTRGQPWDRSLHTRLLNKLADDGCELVVMDSFFQVLRDSTQDQALAAAMRRQHRIVLMAEQSQVTHPNLIGMRPLLPTEPFYSAAQTNWGVAWLDADPDFIVRRFWPFPAPGPYPSLPETAARVKGVQLTEAPHEQWLRYYGPDGAWQRLSYRFALTQPKNYFHDRIVFIGTQPKASSFDRETDQFCTPYTRWTGEATGGVEINVTSFLNLMQDDWLRRVPWAVEGFILVLTGIVFGAGFCRLRPWAAFACAALSAFAVLVGAVWCSYFTSYWFPWLLVAGGQAPCAVAWAFWTARARRLDGTPVRAPNVPAPPALPEKSPDIPGYELLPAPFGQGAYGKVWLARNMAAQWRAVKVIYQANFKEDSGPYDREYKGVTRYQAISDKHPSLLRVDFVSEKLSDHFYYVMELGDPLVPGWEQEPAAYKPRDLASERERSPAGRLPARECLDIGIELSDALDFLHRQGLTHRDIKPQNIIFVDGRPKLADLGLIAEIRPPDQKRTFVGTPGYMPPPPERPGTPQADIYALGIVLYVLSTGRNTAFFPEISTTLAENIESEEFFIVNAIILKACQPDPAQRYGTAQEMRDALARAREALDRMAPGTPTPPNLG